MGGPAVPIYNFCRGRISRSRDARPLSHGDMAVAPSRPPSCLYNVHGSAALDARVSDVQDTTKEYEMKKRIYVSVRGVVCTASEAAEITSR